MSTTAKYLEQLLKTNRDTVYENTDTDKAIIASQLKTRIDSALEKNSAPIGTKNLVYYTVFYGEEYLKILELSLKTLVEFSDVSQFDVLIITDLDFKTKIQAFSVLAKLNVSFMICPTPRNGAEASIQKIKIFEYASIAEYRNILFLDCDVIATKSINTVFSALAQSNPEKLQVVAAPMYSVESRTINNPEMAIAYTLGYRTEEQTAKIIEDKVIPFNTGHFALVNSELMKAHFENLCWFQAVWPGRYFYEQSAMNDYFVLDNNFSEKAVLLDHVKFIGARSIVAEKKQTMRHDGNGQVRVEVKITDGLDQYRKLIEKFDSSTCTFIHFIGSSQDPDSKFPCANEFVKMKNICQ